MLADIEAWKTLVTEEGREHLIDKLVCGKLATWVGSDRGHKLCIKAHNGERLRKLLSSYTNSELGEWFSLMTSIVMAQTLLQVGGLFKLFGTEHPVILAEHPSLSQLRVIFDLT